MHTPKRWVVAETDDSQVRSLAEQVSIPPILATLLWRRGIQTVEEAQRFLYPDTNGFYDPFLMKDMDRATARIRKAIAEQERIMIYGNYDADGATSTALLFMALKTLDANVEYYIPDRFSEGYGLNTPAIETAKEQGFHVIITVDNGISAVEQVRVANELGIDMIVTDHHTPPEVLPDAYAILNPKQPGCNYPDKMLAGVGVAFKLVQALYERIPEEFLDLVAVGTVADLAPLKDENRLMTLYGLRRINSTPSLGIKALIEATGLTGKEITAGHIGFSFGPRINAAGRLDSATNVVQLLTTENVEEAGNLATFLEERNKERQEISEQIASEAVQMAEDHPEWLEGRVLVIASPHWNEGVIGIAASRLVERYYRPTLMISLNEERGKASARSIAGFDLYEALTACSDLLDHYGGHKMAAGFSLAPEKIDELRRRMNEIAWEVLTEEDMKPKIEVDASLPLSIVDLDLVDQIQGLAPYGFGNPSPRFAFTDLKIEETRVVGKDAARLQLRVKSGRDQLKCIAFRRSEDQRHMEGLSTIDIVGELPVNEWNGRRDVQMVLGDWRANPFQLIDKRLCPDKVTWLETSKEQLTVLCFQESSLKEIEKRLFGYPWNEGKYRLYHVDRTGAWQHRAGEDEPTDAVIFYDLPLTTDILEASLRSVVPSQRLFFLQNQNDDAWVRHAVNTARPDRQQFAQVYRLLRDMGQGTIEQLHERTQGALTRLILSNTLRVFCELGFATAEGETFVAVQSVEKRELTESAHYRAQTKRVEKLQEVSGLLLGASTEQLRDWVVNKLMQS